MNLYFAKIRPYIFCSAVSTEGGQYSTDQIAIITMISFSISDSIIPLLDHLIL